MSHKDHDTVSNSEDYMITLNKRKTNSRTTVSKLNKPSLSNPIQIEDIEEYFNLLLQCCLSSGFRMVMLVFLGARFTYYLLYDLFWRYIDRKIHIEVEFPEYILSLMTVL